MDLHDVEQWLEEVSRISDEIRKSKPPNMKIAFRLTFALLSIDDAKKQIESAAGILKHEPPKE